MPKDTTPGTKASKDKFNIHLIKPDPKINNGNEQLAIFFLAQSHLSWSLAILNRKSSPKFSSFYKMRKFSLQNGTKIMKIG